MFHLYQPSTSNQSGDLSVHEIDAEKGIEQFSEVMDQFGGEHYWMKEQAECLEQWTEKGVKMQMD